MKQVICINWGTKYGAIYINRLYRMVCRNITPPFRFVCFTDERHGVVQDIECLDLPPLPGDLPVNTPGIWSKSRLWASELGGLKGPVLFLDLDVVVTASLDPFFEFGEADDVILARNIVKPLRQLGQTSIYRMPVGKLFALFQAFGKSPQAIADEYQYEQYYVSQNAPGGIKFWPRSWVRHFRAECLPPFPLNYFFTPWLPKGTRVVIFAGSLNPPDAIKGQFNRSNPYLAPMAHIRRALGKTKSKRRWRSIKHYLRPTPWVYDHWIGSRTDY